MNEIYLRNWIGQALHCPFCGQRLDSEAIKAGQIPCQHVLLQYVDAHFVYVSDFFVRLANDHFSFVKPDAWLDELIHEGRIQTVSGILSARDVLKQIKIKLEKDFVRCAHFRCDEGSDIGDVTFVAEENYKSS